MVVLCTVVPKLTVFWTVFVPPNTVPKTVVPWLIVGKVLVLNIEGLTVVPPLISLRPDNLTVAPSLNSASKAWFLIFPNISGLYLTGLYVVGNVLVL